MKTKRILTISVLLPLLIISTLTLAFNIQPVKSEPRTIVVPDDYKTIQDAVDAANSGDTIYVRNGFYPEHIDVNKTVTLTGESNQNTIIEAHRLSGYGANGIVINANNTVIENLEIIAPNSTDPTEIPSLVVINGSAPCSNDTVRNCVFVFATDAGAMSDAIDVLGSANNTVTGNLITLADPTDAGIAVISGSGGNLIDNNTINGGWISIGVLFTDNNTLSNNYITDQREQKQEGQSGAVYLFFTTGDTIKGNTLVNNDVAMLLDGQVYSCLIYNNNFVNNTQQAIVGDIVAGVVWDDGFPSGGNFWSDYSGVDVFNGPYQNITGSDGIGDTPYVIDRRNKDNYPLMNLRYLIPGDINGDGRVSLQDLVLLALAYGSKPGDLRWNPNADINRNGVVDLIDLVILAHHYGQHNP